MNIGNCDFANSGKEFEIAEGEKLECPECHKEMLVEVKGTPWKLIAIIAAAVVVLAGAGFGIYILFSGGSEIDKIKLEPKSFTLVVGQKDVVKATVVDKDGNEIKDAKVTYKWTVGDEKIASVTQGGEVTALNKGETSITVEIEGDDKHPATCQIEVKGETIAETLIENISITDATSFTLKEGGTKQLQYQAAPEPNSETPVWVSSDPSVATVDATGLVTAVKKGNVQICVKAHKVASAPIAVTVGDEKVPEDNGNTPGTVKLPFGVYDGPRSNFKANGFGGTITVNSTYTIDLKKASGETVTVHRGDKIVSVKMENNRLRQGEIHFADGTRKYISGL